MACEDYPCCGHEAGDCEGRLYGSDERIQIEWFQHVAYCEELGIDPFDSENFY